MSLSSIGLTPSPQVGSCSKSVSRDLSMETPVTIEENVLTPSTAPQTTPSVNSI